MEISLEIFLQGCQRLEKEHGDWRITKTGSEVEGYAKGMLRRREGNEKVFVVTEKPWVCFQRVQWLCFL